MSAHGIVIDAKRYYMRCEMLADLAVAARLIERARASGTNYGAGTHEQWKQLSAALALVEQVRQETVPDVLQFQLKAV